VNAVVELRVLKGGEFEEVSQISYSKGTIARARPQTEYRYAKKISFEVFTHVEVFEGKERQFFYMVKKTNRINPLTPELNPSAQRCLTRFFYWEFCFLNREFR
jgi:hypothetical protein